MMRTRMIRLISNAVPSNRNPGGKKSVSDGPWNSLSVEADGATRVRA
jgi:hypothetical protein